MASGWRPVGALLLVVVAGCADPPAKVGDPPPGPVPLHLLVSNSSHDLESVEIDIFLDGTQVITGDFEVAGASEYDFDFQVKPGVHEIYAQSSNAGVTYSGTFDVQSETWGLLDFRFAEAETVTTPKQFSWATMTVQPLFD